MTAIKKQMEQEMSASESFKMPNVHHLPGHDENKQKDQNDHENLMGNDRVENSNQNSNKHNDVAMEHTGELESETGMENENDQHVNDEEKPRKTTGQFSAEMEAEQQSSDNGKGDVNANTSKNKSKKKTAKKSQSGSPALRRVAKAIKIIFMSGTLIVGAGAGYLWASQNGYVAMIKNSLTPDETMSQLDTRQNESITKLQLTITDLKTAMQSLQENNRIEKEASQHERNVLAGKVATLETELQQYERNTNSELSTLKGGVNFANASIKTQEELLQGALEAQSKLTKDTEENSVVINRLQRQLTKFSDKLDVKMEEAKKAVREAKKEAANNVSSNTTGSGTSSRSTSSNSMSNDVLSYNGLRFANTFNWSTQKIAVLEDSTGVSFQVSKGSKLGDDSVIDVKDDYIVIRQFRTNRIFKLGH